MRHRDPDCKGDLLRSGLHAALCLPSGLSWPCLPDLQGTRCDGAAQCADACAKTHKERDEGESVEALDLSLALVFRGTVISRGEAGNGRSRTLTSLVSGWQAGRQQRVASHSLECGDRRGQNQHSWGTLICRVHCCSAGRGS